MTRLPFAASSLALLPVWVGHDSETCRFLAAIQEYNVVAIVSGHEAGGHKTWRGIDVLGCNGLGSGFWVVQIEGTRLTAARTIDGEHWARGASAPFNKVIAAGKRPPLKQQARPR